MSFDEWMLKTNPAYIPSDDTHELRLLRGAWNAAVENCASICARLANESETDDFALDALNSAESEILTGKVSC